MALTSRHAITSYIGGKNVLNVLEENGTSFQLSGRIGQNKSNFVTNQAPLQWCCSKTGPTEVEMVQLNCIFFFVVLSLLAINNFVVATKINVHNECSYTVTACDQGPSSSNATCYALHAGFARERDVGTPWFKGGMVWGFPGDNADPDQGLTAWVQADYAYFRIGSGSGSDGMDYYILSTQNGYNLPLMILSNNTQCAAPNCTILNLISSFCQAPNVLTGAPGYGCKNTDGGLSSQTNGTKQFRDKCPTSRSYFSDFESSLLSCPTGSNYEVVFCPTSNQTYTSPSGTPSLLPPPASQISHPPASQISPSPASSIQTGSDGTAFSGWKLGISISSGVLFLLMSFLVCVFFVRRKLMSANLEKDDDEECAFLESLPGLPPRFSYNDLDLATNHFSRIVGEGGFGTVYEGALPDGSKVAVKRLGASKQGQKEFRAEVATIGGINHLRLVRLWGFCSQGAHRMLVYEFLKNSSLDRWLFQDSVLEWAIRYRIATDTAQGLCYLHRDCRHKIIHLDVKPQNILLDDQFRAKVADFGMSKLFDRELSQVETRMRGTPGYLAPEWLLQTAITEKCDVYSYGMVLLEIVSGRKNIVVNACLEKWYFPAWAVGRMQIQSWDEILDARLDGSLSAEEWEQVKKVVKIAMWCIQDKPRTRPSMAKVVEMLEGMVEVNDPPLQFDFLKVGAEDPASLLSSSNTCFGSFSRRESQEEQSDDPKNIEIGTFRQRDPELSLLGR